MPSRCSCPNSTRGSTPARRSSRASLPGSWPKLTTTPDVRLKPGDRVGSLEVVSAPGHTPGHSAFLDTRDRSLIAGDTFTTIGSPQVTNHYYWRFPLATMATWDRDQGPRVGAAPCARLTRRCSSSATAAPVRQPGAAMDPCDHQRGRLMGRSGYNTQWVVTFGGMVADEVGFDQLTLARLAKRMKHAHAVAVRPRRGARRPAAADRRARRAASSVDGSPPPPSGRSGEEALGAIAAAYRAFAAEHPGVYAAVERAPAFGVDPEAAREPVDAVVAALQGYGLSGDDADPRGADGPGSTARVRRAGGSAVASR